MKHKLVLVLFVIFAITPLIGQNLVINSSFEFWLDTLGILMPFGWLTSGLTNPLTATRSTDAHSGLYALRLHSINLETLGFATTYSLVNGMRSYVFHGYVKTNSPIAGSFVFTWHTISLETLGMPVVVPIYRTQNWSLIRRMLNSPDSAQLISINVLAAPNALLLVDDITLIDSTIAAINEQGKISMAKQENTFMCKNKKLFLKNCSVYDHLGRKLNITNTPLSSGIYFIQESKKLRKFIVY
ncbi:MAG: hypothetical protein NZ601_04160 [candidate division WOR-3 bacterium]|nr:hypothetical protein [candidate division WOR-3 bacterium]MCX7757732.1 hypothetical protein [candidate division WOR-3 bacterium]MDW7988155.1 hypothetical protein [candidate division WOR-3 bacterium]